MLYDLRRADVRVKWLVTGLLATLGLSYVFGAAMAAMLHITPVVVLHKRPDAVQALLPGADAYVAREVHLSGTDAHRLHEAVDWSPEDGVLVFYGGAAGSTSVGALEFV